MYPTKTDELIANEIGRLVMENAQLKADLANALEELRQANKATETLRTKPRLEKR